MQAPARRGRGPTANRTRLQARPRMDRVRLRRCRARQVIHRDLGGARRRASRAPSYRHPQYTTQITKVRGNGA